MGISTRVDLARPLNIGAGMESVFWIVAGWVLVSVPVTFVLGIVAAQTGVREDETVFGDELVHQPPATRRAA